MQAPTEVFINSRTLEVHVYSIYNKSKNYKNWNYFLIVRRCVKCREREFLVVSSFYLFEAKNCRFYVVSCDAYIFKFWAKRCSYFERQKWKFKFKFELQQLKTSLNTFTSVVSATIGHKLKQLCFCFKDFLSQTNQLFPCFQGGGCK